jgi:signal transduction histidine kinase
MNSPGENGTGLPLPLREGSVSYSISRLTCRRRQVAGLIAVALAFSVIGNLGLCAWISLPAFFARFFSGCSYAGIVAAALCFRSTGGLGAAALFSISSVAIGMIVGGQTLPEQGEVPAFFLVGLVAGLLAECTEPPGRTREDGLRIDTSDHRRGEVSSRAGYQISPGLLREARTPLFAIASAAYVLENLALTEENHQEMVSIILKECHCLDILLRPLEFAGQRPPAYREVSLSSVLDGVVRLSEPFTATAALTFHRRAVPDIKLICDPELIEQAVLNLLTNALRVMERGEEIVLSAYKKENQIAIEMSHPRMGRLGQIELYDRCCVQQSSSTNAFVPPSKLLNTEASGA